MIKVTKQIVPKIYGYIHPGYNGHDGFIKIGYTDRDVETRVKEDHITSNIKYKIVFECTAINDDKLVFSDSQFHEYLSLKGYERIENLTNSRVKSKPEFFKISLEDLKKEMVEFKSGQYVINKNKNYIPYILRKEQVDAVDLTINYYNDCQSNNELQREFLWNAKPRFGKTLTTYDFIKKINAKRVLIVTNRPVIQDSWFSDYLKFLDGYSDYLFLSAKPIEVNNKKPMTREEQLKFNLAENSFIFFISLQNIKGTVNETEFKIKNQWIFDNNMGDWDVVVIDESHEGVETSKANFVLNNIHKKFTLHLSGTPFKAVASNKFSSNQIYNWTYADEQDAKGKWNNSLGANPYEKLPKMNIYTYELSRALQIELEEAIKESKGYAFDLSEFFSISNGDFTYKEEVIKFIDNLAGFNPNFNPNNKPYPFATEEIRNELKHTFWLLPNRVDIVRAMKNLLKEHPLFKDYEIILAAGIGDSEGEGKRALEKVKNAIKNFDKTITLSCGQLTTGITIPEWSAVLMLSNTGSPSQYLQTAFRAQNPYTYTDSETLKTMYKTDCYLFDFAPDRVLKIVAEYASDLINDGSVREHKIKKLLNFLTVLAEDNEGNLKELNAREILELPLKIITKEVVSRGFMSNKLFDNIANIFGMNTELREIVNKLTPEKNKRVTNSTNMADNNIKLDELGNIITTESEIEHIINTSNGRLVQKEYVVEGTPEALVLQKEIEKYTNGELELDKEQLNKLNNIDIITKEEEIELAKEELTEIKEKDKNSEENQIRDRLRGFSRTIPTFLMAYSRREQIPTLNNFDMDIPDSEFKDLTSISKEEFHKLKDAKLFNEEVFNASIREFIETKKRLADYFINTEEDIFDYIPPQKNNQIYTPKKVVKKMVDLLEENDKNIFKNKETTFIDLYMKSGLFVAEIVKRLYKGLKDEIPNEKARIIHILTKQVFGIAPTDILYNICFEYILGFLKDNVNFNSKDIYTLSNNFKKLDMVKYLQENKNWRKELFGDDMKFDTIIGNPPYQITDGGGGSSAKPVYNYFVEEAINNSPNYVTMIIPSRWFSGGKGLDKFRSKILFDKHIKVLHDYINPKECFPDVSIEGGVCYFLWSKADEGKCEIINHLNDGKIKKSTRYLSSNEEIDILIRDEQSLNILQKVQIKKEESFSNIVNPRNLFSINSDIENTLSSKKNGMYSILGRFNNQREILYLPTGFKIKKPLKIISQYKIFISKADGAAGQIGNPIPARIIGKPEIGIPNQLCTETFLVIGGFDDLITTQNVIDYMGTKFFRFLVGIRKNKNMTQNTYKFVPIIDFSKKWTDVELYQKYNLSKEEINFIEMMIK